MYDVVVILDDRPGGLARLGEVTGAAGINIDGFAAFTGDGRGVVHVLVADEPGAMGDIARPLADAGVNVDLCYTTFGGVRLVFGTDDICLARSVLDC